MFEGCWLDLVSIVGSNIKPKTSKNEISTFYRFWNALLMGVGWMLMAFWERFRIIVDGVLRNYKLLKMSVACMRDTHFQTSGPSTLDQISIHAGSKNQHTFWEAFLKYCGSMLPSKMKADSPLAHFLTLECECTMPCGGCRVKVGTCVSTCVRWAAHPQHMMSMSGTCSWPGGHGNPLCVVADFAQCIVNEADD